MEIGTKAVSVDRPVPVSSETEFGFNAIVMFATSCDVAFRFTLPVKLYRLDMVTVKVARDPWTTITEGVTAKEKSGMFGCDKKRPRVIAADR